MIDPWVAPLGVVIGSLIAYHGLRASEERKHRFELKKEAYFDFLNMLKEGAMLSITEAALKRPKTEDELKADVNHEAKLKKIYIARIVWSNSFLKTVTMIDVCGNKRVINLAHREISELLKEYPENSDRYNQFELDLVNAIREDLLGDYSKHWWQFWK